MLVLRQRGGCCRRCFSAWRGVIVVVVEDVDATVVTSHTVVDEPPETQPNDATSTEMLQSLDVKWKLLMLSVTFRTNDRIGINYEASSVLRQRSSETCVTVVSSERLYH